MLIPFFYMLREGGMSVSITELLTLLEAMKRGVAGTSVDDFYYLSRAALVKDESQFDRFDRLFAAYFKGVEDSLGDLFEELPEDWLRRQAELLLSEEERAKIESLGGFDGTAANTVISTIQSNSGPAISKWRCGGCGSSRVKVRRTSSTSKTP